MPAPAATECRTTTYVVYVTQEPLRSKLTVQPVDGQQPLLHACTAPGIPFALFYCELPVGAEDLEEESIRSLIDMGQIDALYYLARSSDIYDVHTVREEFNANTAAMLLRFMRDQDCCQVIYCRDGEWYPFKEGFHHPGFD